MDRRSIDYLANADTFAALVAAVPEGSWEAASPCAGWSAADVLDHVIGTQRDFFADRSMTLSEATDGSPAQRWAVHHESVVSAMNDEDFALAEYDGYFGPTTVADTMRDFYGWDLVVHRWDIGEAVGMPVSWSDAERAFVKAGLEGFGDQLYMEGICKPAVPVADGADEQTRILGLLGRRASAARSRG
ncbi:MAG: TIGR03086 family protein [Actinomycetales bacterium]|nr:MAG: TIGR03086 family protein [Actinomycetales bacterium]